ASLPVICISASDSEPAIKGISQGAADKAIHFDTIKTPIAQVAACLKVLGRFCRDKVDRATRGVLAEQGALRPFENFNPFEIKPCVACHDREGERGFVQI